MKFLFYLLRFIFAVIFSLIYYYFIFNFFSPIFNATSYIFPYAVNPFDICIKAPIAWKYIKLIYIATGLFSIFIISNSIFTILFKNKFIRICKNKFKKIKKPKGLYLTVGKSEKNEQTIFLPEKSLYQNILITGTIGTGKTSSAMYPFTEQLIKYNCNSLKEKMGLLILDVKGNYYKQVIEFCRACGRLDDLIVLEIGGKYKYNPLDKPNLKASVLASRLKTVLMLFSPETSESFWLDKAEQVLTEAIKLCRLYNNGYVDFAELHKLINDNNYYSIKLDFLRDKFLSGSLSKEEVYNLYSALNFFQNEFQKLDSRTLSILRSEITRMTSTFTSDYKILETFSPKKESLNFNGFQDVLKNGKIVVLNMNIAEYKNLSKIIAAYLKMDFQAEILSSLSSGNIRKSAFICDEYHEYATETDSSFFAQSREAKSINIIATQSYSSILNNIKNESATKVIIQNLINKLWFRNDDLFTIETAQKQIGKEYKTKITKSISENAVKTNYNYLMNSLGSENSGVSETLSTSINFDFIYDFNFFTQNLETFSCLAFLSDGNKILPPQKIKMFPFFKIKK